MIIKVLLYDDNEIFLQSIEALLSMRTDLKLVAGFTNAEKIEEDLSLLKPDVILMDIDMPKVNGVTAVGRIRKVAPELPVIMLTVFDDNENIFKALCAGASGYILKKDAENELVDAVRMVLEDGAPMTGSIAKKVLHMLPKAKNTDEEHTGLTKKEIAILQYMVQGYSYKMIAVELHNKTNTIRYHIKSIYNKLHVHSATEAVSKAIKDRLV